MNDYKKEIMIMRKCPFCSEEIQAEAIKCKFCGESQINVNDKVQSIFSKGQDHLKNAIEKVKSATETVMNHPKTKAALKSSKQFCDEKGVTDKAVKAANKLNDGKKTFTGEKASEDVNKFLNLQNCYNDLLATKLEEALKRIELLEQRLEGQD